MTSRIPVRIRLVIAFAAVMAVVLTATGMFVYLRVADELGDTVDRELSARLASVATIVRDDGDDLGDPDDDPLQAVDQGGLVQVLDSAERSPGPPSPRSARTPCCRRLRCARCAPARRSTSASWPWTRTCGSPAPRPRTTARTTP